MVKETLQSRPDIFPGLSPDKATILAENISVIEATYGDPYACRICYIKTPIGVQHIIPARTISAIHDFIINHSVSDRSMPINYHHRGQLTDYYDPESGWDMTDVLIDGLRTGRPLALFLHGILDEDSRAFDAAARLASLPDSEKERIHVVVSTDPFGPCDAEDEYAEEIGRHRTLNALKAFKNMPYLRLSIYYAHGHTTPEKELQKAKNYFGRDMPSAFYLYSIVKPTRSALPGIYGSPAIDTCIGYYILIDGQVLFRKSTNMYISTVNIGNISRINSDLIGNPSKKIF